MKTPATISFSPLVLSVPHSRDVAFTGQRNRFSGPLLITLRGAEAR